MLNSRCGTTGSSPHGAQREALRHHAEAEGGGHRRRAVGGQRRITRRAGRTAGGWRAHQVGRARADRRSRGDCRARTRACGRASDCFRHHQRGRRRGRPAPHLGGAGKRQTGRCRPLAVALGARWRRRDLRVDRWGHCRRRGRARRAQVFVRLGYTNRPARQRCQGSCGRPRRRACIRRRRLDGVGLVLVSGGHSRPAQLHLVRPVCGRRGVPFRGTRADRSGWVGGVPKGVGGGRQHKGRLRMDG